MAAAYRYDNSRVWAEAYRIAKEAVAKAQRMVEAESERLGIPRQFAPELACYWYGRGENAVAERRAELRKVARAQIASLEAEAILAITAASLAAQTELALDGLESDAARSPKTGALSALCSRLPIMPRTSRCGWTS